MKHFYLLLLSIFIIQSNYAQNTTTALADYKLPEINYHGLNFNFFANGHVNETRYDGFPGLNGARESNIYSRLNLNYFSYLSNNQRQRTKRIGLQSNPYSRTKYSNKDQLRIFHSLRINTSDYFYKANNKFWGYDVNTYVNHQYFSEEQNNKTTDGHWANATIDIPLYIGKGRIEEVTDIWYAKRILQKLSERDVIVRNYNDDELIEFAQEVSNVRHDRVFDFRLDRIADIKTLDSWLQYKGLIKNNGAEYFTTLYDYYNNGAQVTRYSGTRYTLGVSPFVDYNNNTSFVIEESTFAAGYLFAKYDNYHPINDEWQFDINATLLGGYGLHIQDINYAGVNYDGYLMGGNLQLTLGYYPTSRISYTTSFIFAAQQSAMLLSNTPIKVESPTNYIAQLSQRINYYISHRTSINFNFRAGIRDQETSFFQPLYNNTNLPLSNRIDRPFPSQGFNKKWYGNFNIGFSHDIF